MPDPRDVANARNDSDLEELRGRIGNLYTRMGLSPPSQLYTAVEHWLGLSHEEILAAIKDHFAQHRRLYVSGSGDGYFYLVEAAIRRAWQAKHPTRDRANDEHERPRNKRLGRVRPVHHAGGVDVFDDNANPDWLTVVAQPRPAPPQSYRESGESIGEDEDVD